MRTKLWWVTSFGAPPLREPAIERLRYFAPFLEHADPTIAEDAYLEFGRAPFDIVEQVADELSSEQVRKWLLSDRVPEARKGLYGLILGLAKNPVNVEKNTMLLKQLIEADENDFRTGFDGVLGGYLLLTGNNGLRLIEDRYLNNPQAAVVDVRHAMTALRFCHEYNKDISKKDLSTALAKVLKRPAFAEAAIRDLGRWQYWNAVDQIANLYEQPGFDTSEIRRAIVGYLRICDDPSAAKRLAALRAKDPHGVAAAEEVLTKFGNLPQ